MSYVNKYAMLVSNCLCQQVDFMLKRQPLSIVILMFVPSAMLLAIGYSTLHVKLALTQVTVTLYKIYMTYAVMITCL